MIDVRSVAQRLGGEVVGRNTVLCPGPHHSRRDRSLQVTLRHDAPEGFLVHSFSGDDWVDCRDYVRPALGLGGWERQRRSRPSSWRHNTSQTVAKAEAELEDEAAQLAKARRLWARRQPLAGSVAERYLRDVRGYTGSLPSTLGFLPRWRDYSPALIAAVTEHVDEPEPHILSTPRSVECVHLTLLRDDGSDKVGADPNKKLISSPSIRDPLTKQIIASRPIILAPVNDLLGLAICEGIEDALSAHLATGLGAWAGINAGFMGRMGPMVPAYVETVTVFAHDDKAGRNGAHTLAIALDRRNRNRDDPFSAEIRMEGFE